MQRLKSGLLNLLTVMVSVALMLGAAEIVLRFLPVATALPVEPPSRENPIQRYVASQPYVWSLGWKMEHVVRGRSNAQGFLADYDYEAGDPRPLVAVVGDSYVEAMPVTFAQSVTGRLQSVLGPNGRAYVFAQSGAPLTQYVAYARHACEAYRPQRLVVNVVGTDFDESVYKSRRRNGMYHLHPRPDGGFDYKLTPLPPRTLIERVGRHSALAYYLMRNVSLARIVARMGITQSDSSYVGSTDAAAGATRVEEGYAVIDWFLNELPRAACLPANDIVIVVDSPRPQIYGAAALAAVQGSYFSLMRKRVIVEARARGFTVVDTEPLFLAAYAADGRRFEHPLDGHWNEHGHEVVAAAVREALTGWPLVAASPAR